MLSSDGLTVLKISYCDWWHEEYCGGHFDFSNNFITNMLINYGNVDSIIVVNPSENPDLLFYSIFGYEHLNYTNVRRVFFSGEPLGAREKADFNLTFDKDSDINTRFPLWLGYLNYYLLEECQRRKNCIVNVPERGNFCSFIASNEVKTTHRRTIVEKLSTYKIVHCGGQYLNNIGYVVPRGENCSGKIEHNSNYKFVIAFENEDYPGYVTEKICDVYKSNSVPIYWGTKDVVNDFNPTTFINANDFANFDELVEYIIKVDNDDELYSSFFKEPMFSDKWLHTFSDSDKTYYKNIVRNIIGKSKEKIVIYGRNHEGFLIRDYVNNLNLLYDVTYVNSVGEIHNNPSKILLINEMHDNSVFDTFKNAEIGILNIDSLYITEFFNIISGIISLYPNIKIYDYSVKNIEILQNRHTTTQCEFLEYKYDEKEVSYLKEINKQPKLYDFGLIAYHKDVSCSKRRKYIVDKLREQGYSVNIACGFYEERDNELSKCKIILNIHSKSFDIECRTFEHLRCNRLLYAGFKILSEVSYICDNFALNFSNNIKFIKYDDFENITRENIEQFDIVNKLNNNF